MSEKKKKKESEPKVVYYDDGSTVADMSNVRGGITGGKKSGNGENKSGAPKGFENSSKPPKATFREKARTFFAAMKTMVIPMCVVLAVLAVLYLILYFISAAQR